MNSKIDQECINNIRTVAMETITNASSGHPGIALGAAPILHTLYSRFMKIDPANRNWINRDRFVLAAGHGSALLYTILHLCSFGISQEDLKKFRTYKSITPGHPEIGITPGVDASSGPLGLGIGTAVGLAIAEAFLNHKFPSCIDHYTYALCGDGDMEEGATQEAFSVAGALRLNKLIVLYDSNEIQLDGKVSDSNKDNVQLRMQSLNWKYLYVQEGECVEDIANAIMQAQQSDLPTLIEIRTRIGKTSSLENSNKVHGAPLKKDEVEKMRQKIGGVTFSSSFDVCAYYYDNVVTSGKNQYSNWENNCDIDEVIELRKYLDNKFDINFEQLIPPYPLNNNIATRTVSGEIIYKLSSKHLGLIGGTADVSSSVKLKMDSSLFSSENREGRNIAFGVREQAMGLISNGIALHKGLKPICGAFFVFSDFVKASIRLAALMELPNIYVFSHDSLMVGEDGPTHQPIEQMTMLRSIPGVNVIRPADANETREAFRIALLTKKTPTIIVLTRQDVPTIVEPIKCGLSLGGYVLSEEDLEKDLDGILIASGSEVSLALQAQKRLQQQGTNVRVVSMPSTNLFDQQSEEYKESVLPSYIAKRVAIEMSDACHMFKYTGLYGVVINVDCFGLSSNGEFLAEEYGFTVEEILDKYNSLQKVDVIRYLK